jgi:xanthine dehydrogenase molybdopterin-binding subunit B
MTRPLPAAAPLAGQPVTRVDGRLKVTGAARYAADNPTPDLVHGVLVCSTVSRATVDGIETKAALDHPDVIRALTDFTGVTMPFDMRRVSFFGQPLAIVIANTLDAATHAAGLVQVHYGTDSPLTDLDDPAAKQEPSTNGPDYSRGDADTVVRSAAVKVDATYSIARNYHNPMEIPATIAQWDGDRLTVWDKVQGINLAQEAYSKAFGVPTDSIRVISPFVGGAFGSAEKPGPTNCSPRLRPARCAARSNSRSRALRRMPRSATGQPAGNGWPSLPIETAALPRRFMKAGWRFRAIPASKTRSPRAPDCSTARRRSAPPPASSRSTSAPPPTCEDPAQ